MEARTWQRYTKRPLGCLLIEVVTVLDKYPVLSTIHEAAVTVAALFSMLEPLDTKNVLWGGWGRLVAALDRKHAACHMCYWEGCVCFSAVTAVVSLESIPFNFSRVYIAQRTQYCIRGTTCSYFVLFCQNTAHKIINNILSACVRRMHTFCLYGVT